jgi:hypothetical protein
VVPWDSGQRRGAGRTRQWKASLARAPATNPRARARPAPSPIPTSTITTYQASLGGRPPIAAVQSTECRLQSGRPTGARRYTANAGKRVTSAPASGR